MLKRAKRWYNDTHRHKRYGWGVTISGVIGLAVFCFQMAKGTDFHKAFDFGHPLIFVTSIVVLVLPQMIIDWIRGYWKHGSELDEMEKIIFQRASRIALTSDYAYFCTVLPGIMFYSDARDIEQIPVSALGTVLMGAVFVLIWAQGIAYVVLYGRRGNTEDLENLPEQSGSGMSKDQAAGAKER